MNVPWDEIKADYVAGNMSYADLAAAHGVSLRAVEERGKNESWVNLRREARGKTAAKLTDAISDAKVKKIEKIVDQLMVQCQIASRQLSKRMKRITESETTADGTIRITVRTGYEDGKYVDVGNLKALTDTVYKLDDMMRKQRVEDAGGADGNQITVVFESADGNDYSA